MGFFSYLCHHCNKPLLSFWSIQQDGKNAWMSHAVVFTEDGWEYNGIYDGYGRIDGCDRNLADMLYEQDVRFTVYHEACSEICNNPGFHGQSKNAPDQGYFFSDGEYDIPRPTQKGGEQLCQSG